MAIKLKEVVIKNDVEAYAAEFFDLVAAQPEGKLFAFDKEVKEVTIRSYAQSFGKALRTKFTVVTVTPAKGESLGSFAVGVTSKVRKTRAPKTPVAPVSTESPTTAGLVFEGPANEVAEAILAVEWPPTIDQWIDTSVAAGEV